MALLVQLLDVLNAVEAEIETFRGLGEAFSRPIQELYVLCLMCFVIEGC